MGGSSGSAPEADPKIGEAAQLSAQTGQQALEFMQGQAAISNAWATADRDYYLNTFRPLEQQFVSEAQAWDTPERREAAAADARAGVQQASSLAQGQASRQLTAMGVSPGSARFASTMGSGSLNTQLAALGAGNAARDRVRAEGDAKMAMAVGLGSGMAVNPGSSLGMAGNAGAQGFNAAMGGYGQQGNLLNTQYQQQMQAWEANAAAANGLWSGIGGLAGTAMSMGWLSDETKKEGRRPARGALDALRSMPVDTWRYKAGVGDGGAAPHVGPMAQDFHAATGAGDGRMIPAQDAVGLTMGAVKELADKVDRLDRRGRGAPKPRVRKAA